LIEKEMIIKILIDKGIPTTQEGKEDFISLRKLLLEGIKTEEK